MAVALEDPNYEISEMVYDLANLRAGHRFVPGQKQSPACPFFAVRPLVFVIVQGIYEVGFLPNMEKEQLILFVSVPSLRK